MKSPAPTSLTPIESLLFYFSCFLSGSILLLLLAGGLVTSHEAGLAVPDWPLSYGQLMPPMVGNIFWEHGHRMIAGTVGILTLLLALALQRWEPRSWIKKLGWVSFLAVVIQAVLGGLTVRMMLPAAVSIFHACLAQTFFCLIVSLTYFLSPRYKSGTSPSKGLSSPRLFIMTTGLIYLQLILGAIVRHAHQGIVLHVLNAFLVIFHIMLSVGKITRLYQADRFMIRLGTGWGFLTLVQFFLGMGAFIFTQVIERGYAPSQAEVIFTATHQTMGALVLAFSVLISVIGSRY